MTHYAETLDMHKILFWVANKAVWFHVVCKSKRSQDHNKNVDKQKDWLKICSKLRKFSDAEVEGEDRTVPGFSNKIMSRESVQI